VSLAVLVEATEELVLRRLGGRRTCPSCGAVYNIHTLPSKVEGVCDRCGAKTVIRDDDRPETIRQRLKVNEEQSAPLAALYRERGILRSVDGGSPLEDVVDRIVRLAQGVPVQ
jgi:adenylate kinase